MRMFRDSNDKWSMIFTHFFLLEINLVLSLRGSFEVDVNIIHVYLVSSSDTIPIFICSSNESGVHKLSLKCINFTLITIHFSVMCVLKCT